MRIFVYVCLPLFFQVQGDIITNSIDEQCSFVVNRYKYISKARFQHVPTTIIDQTALDVTADVDYYYQSKASCNHSFIKLENLIINSFQNESIQKDTKQLALDILQIFMEISNVLENKTEDIVFSIDYNNNTNQYRRIKTVRTNAGQYMGNSVFANYVFNKIFSATKTTCDTIININEQKLENSICISTTAGLVTVNRQINFERKIDNQKFVFKNENITSIELKLRSKDDFDLLLKQTCTNDQFNSQYQLINMMNNELQDEDLNQILSLTTNQYSNCEWTMINRSIIEVARFQATEFLLKNFYHDQSVIEHHFDLIERKADDKTREILKKYLNNPCHLSNLITLRMLILISDDNLTIQCGLNRNNHLNYRAITFRILNNRTIFFNEFRTILNDEQEFIEIRIVAFQAIYSSLNSSEIKNLIETIQSRQMRFYIKSIFNQSSIWLGNSGSYLFPFGKINVIFDENRSSFIPKMIQLELGNQMEMDLYFLNTEWEILLMFDRKSLICFSTINDFLKWLNNDWLFQMQTLDGFNLKIKFKIDFNLKWFSGYFNQFRNFFRKSTAGIVLKIQHGLTDIMTGYEMSFILESNFKIIINQNQYSTSYIWRSIEKENVIFQIEQTINPIVGNKQILLKSSSSSPTKDFCYIIPHFDSKICLSFLFERLWPSSIAIRFISDDPSLVYNLTSSNNFIHFNIQQNQKMFRSYHLTRKYNEHSWLPYYLELSTPTNNYTSFINWTNQTIISFNLFNKNQSIANGSGLYQYDLLQKLSVNLTEIHPNHIGNVFIDYNGNLTIHAPKLLGSELNIRIDRLPDWNQGRIAIKAERAFFFFKQNFLFNLHYNILQSSFNLTLTRNNNSQFQWAFMKDDSHIHHLLIINTSLIELDHHTQVQYGTSPNIGFQSSSLINGWSLWNITALVINAKQVQIQFNQLSFHSQIDNRTIQFEMNYSNQKLFRTYFQINSSNSIIVLMELPGYCYESEGKLSAKYTNFSLDFPIIETILGNTKKKSHLQIKFSSLATKLLLNITSTLRNEYYFTSIHNFTFLNQYVYQTNTQSSLIMIKMIRYQLFSFDSFSQYLHNSSILRSWNGSIILPSLFFPKPLVFNYKKDSQLFIQFFHWANLTRTLTTYNISTNFGLHLSTIDDLSTKIYLRLEQNLFGKRFLLLFEIDRNWIISLIINKKTRYEFIVSPIDSLFILKRINLNTNQTRLLPINYYTNNQTLIRIEIFFSKSFSSFINDFILDVSLRNHTLKIFCHIPLFRREFFLLTWNRYLHKELFHFHGSLQMKLLRRRQLIDYDYNWNLASFRFWTFDSRLILFSFDPIQLNLNLTNDYFWYGKWAVDYRLMLGNRRELIRLNHKYQYTSSMSNLLFDLSLVNSHYDLYFNYYHFNHSIQGQFSKNKYKHEIDGYWSTTMSTLQLNTQHMKSITTITSTFIKSIIDMEYQKLGVLFESTKNNFTNDTQITECNPYLIIQSRPQLFIIHYYTLNDDLSTMMFEWSTRSYLSWNYTSNARILFPLTKFEIDIRTKYIFRIHTSTFKYSSIYNIKNRQLTIRREPIAVDADDRFELKMKFHHNRTFLIHLQVINNHYEIIGDPYQDDFDWKLHGYLQHDPFNGSLLISNHDWWLSSKLNFNSSLYISTGRYVQLIQTSDPQIAFEILLINRLHIALQYSGLQSLIALKLFHNSSNINIFFSSKSMNETMFNIDFHFNNMINQSWILEIDDEMFYLYNHNHEFIVNGSLQEFSFQHFIENRKNEILFNENTIRFTTNNFDFIISNLSSDTTRYIHLYHRSTKQNLTINYYRSGRFFREGYNIQTPIYDVNIIYYPTDDENRSVIILLEFLPLQMSSFNLVRGRSFRIGYQTKEKQLILSGNIAFGIDDIDDREKITMNERWKLIYGINKRDKIYIKWNINIDSKQKTLRGRMTIQDPNEEMSIPVYSDINAQLRDMMIIINMSTVYSSSKNLPKPIILQINVDQRIITQQYISLNLIHEISNTNLSFTIDHFPQRNLRISLKPNNYFNEKIYLHLYANTTESQLKLLLILANQINLNLTLPKSYPETGLLHSSLFIENEEYFDGRLDTAVFKLRTKEYTFNVSLHQLILQKRLNKKILASVLPRWIERNSSTALITIFSEPDFERKLIPIWQSAQQETWFKRFKQFLFNNNLTSQFSEDFREFFDHLKTDFTNEHGQFGVQLINDLNFDEDFKLGLQRINYTTTMLVETLFQIGFFGERLFQEYMNNLTCLINHQNLFHLDLNQLVTLTIDSFVFEIVYYVNKTLIMFNHLTHYPRSMNAMIAYLSNELILNIYKSLNDFYLETKQYFLSKLIQYSHELHFLLKISPLLSDSITFFSSNDIRTIIYLFNDRFRRLLSIWINSPIEYKLMKTIASQLIELIDKIRFHLDDKLDFLLPIVQIYTPRLSTNNTRNQTFLLTWSKQENLSNIIREE